jgi:alpha-tubulin suppressor-like RCC1 family protein
MGRLIAREARTMICGRSRDERGRVLAAAGRQRLAGARARSALVAAMAALVLVPASAAATVGVAGVSWGSNGHFELGAGYHNAQEYEPVTIVGLSEIKQLVAAGQSSYALLSNGTVRSWGNNEKEELGDNLGALGAEDERLREPEPNLATVMEQKHGTSEVHELTGVTAIAATYGAYTHAMAIVNGTGREGEVVTWGAGEYGEGGHGESGFEKAESSTPRDRAQVVGNMVEGTFVPLKHIVGIGTASNSDFAIQEESGKTKLWAWGENAYGKLGIGTTSGPTKCEFEEGKFKESCAIEPVQVDLPEGVNVKQVNGGKDAAYALLSNGEVMGWGADAHGQLGNGETETTAVPVYVCAVGATVPCGSSTYLKGITAIAAAPTFALALTEGGEVVGWGGNQSGNLTGTSSEECSMSEKTCQKIPKKLTGLEKVSQITTGGGYGLALSEGKVYGWGNSEEGHLGIGTKEGPETCGEASCSRSPVKIEGLPPVAEIVAGSAEKSEGHALAALESGSGPAEHMSLTPEVDALKVTWTVSAEEFHIDYRLKVKPEGEEIRFSSPKKTCSAEAPCTETITGLEAGKEYEVHLNTFNSKKLSREYVAWGTPEA